VLIEETLRMARARDLRAFGKRGQEIKVFINLIGTLFIRTIERAERIYNSMLSRGFSGTVHYVRRDHLRMADFVCLLLTGILLVLLRTYDLVNLVGRQAERMF
jgi:cobalt/nickel transport system permease protein